MAITMASLRTAAIVATLIITATHHSTSAKPPSPPTQPGIAPVSARAITECFRALVNTSDCLSYVKSESNLTKPEKGCCPEIAGLVESNPICLCELLSHPGASGFAIDIKKALNLPSVCGVSSSSAPNVTSCSAAGVPVSLAPISQDAMSPSEIPAEGSARNPSSEESTLSYLESQDDEDEASSIIKDSTLNFILLGFSTFIIFTLS
ncbi:non-specific lipid transfer protein GPI-anchored 12-like isoform X1 [Prosopis cineraria]|uniref:non-specific lipid transfer protein GPI-anchored 12-like isoform X1 n=1 Tax=Prosopis cineraria TaxID=364024 RepID=UPI00240F68F5|nr:non-specific lipid transfer protein GPI-anchored 12-like isoform X1 [Prosopis cineraria]